MLGLFMYSKRLIIQPTGRPVARRDVRLAVHNRHDEHRADRILSKIKLR